MKEESVEFQEGLEARFAKKTPEDNPYEDEAKMNDWFRGYFAKVNDEVYELKKLAEDHGMKKREECKCGCMSPTFTTAKDALTFLSGRFSFAGVDHGVALMYKRDIDRILDNMRDTH